MVFSETDRVMESLDIQKARVVVSVQLLTQKDGEQGSTYYSGMLSCIGQVEIPAHPDQQSSRLNTLGVGRRIEELTILEQRTASHNAIATRFDHKTATMSYYQIAVRLDMGIVPLPNTGGCYDTNWKGKTFKIRYGEEKTDEMRVFSPATKDDNCLFGCISKFLAIKGSKTRRTSIRQATGIQGPISQTQVTHILREYESKGFASINAQIYDGTGQLTFVANNEPSKEQLSMKLLLTAPINNTITQRVEGVTPGALGHWYLITQLHSNHCDRCGVTFDTVHVCNQKRRGYYQRMVMKKNVLPIPQPQKDPKHIEFCDLNNLVYFDLESFQSEEPMKQYHQTYAAGLWVPEEQEYYVYWGEDSLEQLYEKLYNLPGKTIVAWNGE